MSANPMNGSQSPNDAKTIDASDRSGYGGFREWLFRALLVLCGLLAITAYGPILPVDWWWVRIGDFPRLQLLIAYGVGLLAILPYGRRRWAQVAVLIYLSCMVIQLYWIFPYLPFAPEQVERARSENSDARLRILSANVLQTNQNPELLLRLVAHEQPDLVVLCEVNDRWVSDLAPLKQQFRQHVIHPLDNKYGIAMYTNLEIVTAQVRSMVREDIPSIDARLRLRNGQEVRVFAVHPNPPRPGEDTTKRDAELVLVGREVRNDDSVIVLGDLNDVGWSRTTDLFKEVSRLLDPRVGRGLYATYNANSWILRYPLDYLFHSEDFRLVELRRLPHIGSDHFPLLVELSHEPDAAATQEAPELDRGDREDAEEAVEAVQEKE
jgi:endonuclease/exonuclease/phosphatase (EEP) superfamily protein YafD